MYRSKQWSALGTWQSFSKEEEERQERRACGPDHTDCIRRSAQRMGWNTSDAPGEMCWVPCLPSVLLGSHSAHQHIKGSAKPFKSNRKTSTFVQPRVDLATAPFFVGHLTGPTFLQNTLWEMLLWVGLNSPWTVSRINKEKLISSIQSQKKWFQGLSSDIMKWFLRDLKTWQNNSHETATPAGWEFSVLVCRLNV